MEKSLAAWAACGSHRYWFDGPRVAVLELRPATLKRHDPR